MRVIAGVARRTVLVAPVGNNTRPTADRAKEGLFNVLSPKIRDARFLDLFCGSGAIGIEALSRGAAQVVFVDNSRLALNALKENLDKTRLMPLAEIFAADVADAIATLVNAKRVFDIIFFDPPYGTYLLEETLANVKKLLAPGGVIIAETDVKESPEIFADTAKDIKIYGRTGFFFFSEDVA